MSLCLNRAELEEITGRKMPSAQMRYLKSIGIIAKLGADGYPRVLRAHIFKEYGGMDANTVKQQEFTPNWGGLPNAKEAIH